MRCVNSPSLRFSGVKELEGPLLHPRARANSGIEYAVRWRRGLRAVALQFRIRAREASSDSAWFTASTQLARSP